MRTSNTHRLALFVAIELLLLGAVAVLHLLPRQTEPTRPADLMPPELDQDLLRAIAPVVHADLPSNRKVVWSGSGGRWFCAESPVETVRVGEDIRFGLVVSCSEYSVRDGALVTNAGLGDCPLVVTLSPSPNGYRIRDIEMPQDGSGNRESLRRMFSTSGYFDIDRVKFQSPPDPAPEARVALGLPPDAPVVIR